MWLSGDFLTPLDRQVQGDEIFLVKDFLMDGNISDLWDFLRTRVSDPEERKKEEVGEGVRDICQADDRPQYRDA